VSELCGVKPHVLRYWEQEFTQLRPLKRKGNRRYYQHHEVLLVRRIRELLYEQGFTISGARNRLDAAGRNARARNDGPDNNDGADRRNGQRGAIFVDSETLLREARAELVLLRDLLRASQR
jgi:DNA-binding transcriptional MerR regulator